MGCFKAAECVCIVHAMQDKLVAVVQDSLDVMQKKMVHNIQEFTSLDVSFVWCTRLFNCQLAYVILVSPFV